MLVAFPVEFLPDSGLFANTFFHVACLAEQISCSKGEIEHFWSEELEWSDEERDTLASLQSFLSGVGNAAPDPGPVAVPPNFPGYYPSYRRRYEVLNRVLEAGSNDGIADAVSELLEPPDAQQLQHTFAQFEERLRPWWEATGRYLVPGYDKKSVNSTALTLAIC